MRGDPSDLDETYRGLLFADLRGYSADVERYGDRAASALLDAFRSLVRQQVAEHAGAEIKTEGDSFYVVFPSARRAVTLRAARPRVAARATQEAARPGSDLAAKATRYPAARYGDTRAGYLRGAVAVGCRTSALTQRPQVCLTGGHPQTEFLGVGAPPGRRANTLQNRASTLIANRRSRLTRACS